MALATLILGFLVYLALEGARQSSRIGPRSRRRLLYAEMLTIAAASVLAITILWSGRS